MELTDLKKKKSYHFKIKTEILTQGLKTEFFLL